MNNIFSTNRIAGAEIVLSGSNSISVVILKKEKSSVVTELSKDGLKNTEELAKDIPPGTALQVSINGKGIIHKKLPADLNDNDKNYLQAILPNANTNDFYIQKTKTTNDQVFVSVIRKQTLDELLNQLQEKEIQVIACYLGPFAINSILPLLSRDELSFQNHQLKFSENTISDYQTTDDNVSSETISMGDESIKPSQLLSFATAFSYFLNTPSISSNVESIAQQKEEFRQKNIFQKSMWLVAGVFFVLLMTNFLLFNTYFTKKNEIGTQLSFNQEKLSKYEALKKEYDDKKSVIEKLGLNRSSKTSYYADQLAMNMPNSILLSKLSIYPAIKRTDPTETVYEFNTNLIKVEGACSKSVEVNEWIKIIKQKNWIQDVVLVNYEQGKESDRGDFLLELKLK